MKVMKETGEVEMEYRELCEELGFDPSVRFIRVNSRHTIGWTVGKDHEVRALKRACMEHGYRMSKALADF